MANKVHVHWHTRNVRVPALRLARKSESEIADLTAPVWYDEKRNEWNIRMARRPGGIVATHVINRADIQRYHEQKSDELINKMGMARLGPIRAHWTVLDKLVNHMEKQA